MTHIHYNVTSSYIEPSEYPCKTAVTINKEENYQYIPSTSFPDECAPMTYEEWEKYGTFPTGNTIIMHECNHKPVQQIPGWMHIDPINTQIDLQSVADMLSDYDYTPGLKVTVEDLTNPAPMDLPYGKNF